MTTAHLKPDASKQYSHREDEEYRPDPTDTLHDAVAYLGLSTKGLEVQLEASSYKQAWDWLRGDRNPSFKYLIKLIDFLLNHAKYKERLADQRYLALHTLGESLLQTVPTGTSFEVFSKIGEEGSERLVPEKFVGFWTKHADSRWFQLAVSPSGRQGRIFITSESLSHPDALICAVGQLLN